MPVHPAAQTINLLLSLTLMLRLHILHSGVLEILISGDISCAAGIHNFVLSSKPTHLL